MNTEINDFQLVIALVISGGSDVNFTQLGLSRLLEIPVAVVGSSGIPGGPLAVFVPQYLVQFHSERIMFSSLCSVPVRIRANNAMQNPSCAPGFR